MHRYKIFIITFLVFSYGLAAYTFLGNRELSKDSDTEDRMSQVYNNIDDYSTKNGSLPDANNAVISSDKTIAYVRYSDNVYALCATFVVLKAGNEQYSDSSSLDSTANQQIEIAIQNLKKENPRTNYINGGSYLNNYSSHREKGRNCYVLYKEFYDSDVSNVNNQEDNASYSTSQNDVAAKCTGDGSYDLTGIGVITKTDVDNTTSGSGSITLYFQSALEGSYQVFEYDSVTKFYDKNCKEVTINSLKANDTVKYYGYAGSNLVDVIELQ